VNDWSAELRRCVRCGACREVCPVFAVTKMETDVARGRLASIERAGQLGRLSAADREAISRCLLCGRCAEVCQSEIRVADIVRDAKARAGAAGFEFWAANALADPKRLARMTRRARSFLEWLARATPDESGLRLRFALPYLETGRYFPRPPKEPYLTRVATRPAVGATRIALFLGCGAGRLFEGISDALDTILAQFDLTAAVPEQACCGLPAWGVGADRAARDAALNWLDVFSGDYEAILSPCASCTAHLQKNIPMILAATPREDEAKAATNKVHDFFAWLRRSGWRIDRRGARVAVHLPCHARHDVREGDALVALLRECGADVIALPAALENSCCGMGGTFGVRHPELSRAIGERKISAMLRERPEVILTSCSGCLLQLRDLADRLGATAPILHAAQWLAG